MALPTLGDTSTGYQASGATLTFAHVVATGEVLVVGAGSAKEGTNQITGVTFNGVAMTKAVDRDGVSAGYTSIWYLASPSVGTFNVVVTVADNTRGCGAEAISFLGADTTTPIGATNSSTPGSASSISTSLTINQANSIVFGFMGLNGTGRTITVTGTNQTDRGQGTGESQYACSTQTTTTATSYTDSWSFSSGQVCTQCLVEVKSNGSSPSSSLSPSPSSSISKSTSSSASPSPSSSQSPSSSLSLSPSLSISFSPSSSASASPSPSWAYQPKNSSSWVNSNKNTSTMANQSKNNSSWTNQTKS